MLNMIKADMYRMLKGKGIYICFIIIILMALISVYSISPGHIGLAMDTGNTNQTEDYGLTDEEILKINETNSISDLREILLSKGSYDLDISIVSQNANLYYFFIAIVVMVLCCDFSNGTIKNTVSTNISKKKYYLSKLVLALGLGTIIIFFNSYISYVLSLLMNGSNFVSSISNITLVTIKQLPYLYGIIGLLVMLSTLTRKTAIYNGISIPLVMGFQLILMSVINLFNISGSVWDYEFQTALSKICYGVTNNYTIWYTCIGLLVLVGSSLIGYYNLSKRDI